MTRAGADGWLTGKLARFVADTPNAAIDAVVRERAVPVLLDTIGCIVGGWSAAEATPLLRWLSGRSDGAGRGDAGGRVLGATHMPAPDAAALVNGTLGAALQFDDVSRVMGGHPSVPVVAALAACSARTAVSGAQFLSAYIVGVEVSARVGQALGREHATKGWHTSATAGVFGTTAAVARLRGLDVGEVEHALGTATSLASGTKAAFGSMTRAAHAGWTAHAGVLAADLAASGLTGPLNGLEADNGFFALFGGTDASPAAFDGLGERWLFVAPGDGLKLYPCHGATHRALDAALTLRSRHALSAEDIASIRCRNPPPWFRYVPRLIPTTGAQGRLSMEYILAAAFIDGRITQSSFTDEAVARPEITAMYPRIELIEDERMMPPSPYVDSPDRPPYEGYVRVEVRMADGAEHSSEVEISPGAPGRDLDREAVDRKFLDLACGLGGIERAAGQRFIDSLDTIDQVMDVARLLALLAVPRGSG